MKPPIITIDDYLHAFAGYFLTDCNIAGKDVFSFVMRNFEDDREYSSLEEGKIRKKIVWLDMSDKKTNAYHICTLTDSANIFTASAKNRHTEVVDVNGDGFVYIYDSGEFLREDNLTEQTGITDDGFSLLREKSIGEMIHVCGQHGYILRREKKSQWKNISISPEHFPEFPLTVVDIDGFSPDDIYALVWDSGVFHWNGETWRRIPFPSNILLETICCGADGKVYISGQRGTIFAGRGNRWNRIHEGELTLPFMDTVWYQDALWCTNDYGVWTLREGTFEPAPVPDEVTFCSGHLSTRDGLLLLGGMNGAILYNGSEWQPLYYQLEILAGMLDTEG